MSMLKVTRSSASLSLLALLLPAAAALAQGAETPAAPAAEAAGVDAGVVSPAAVPPATELSADAGLSPPSISAQVAASAPTSGGADEEAEAFLAKLGAEPQEAEPADVDEPSPVQVY